MFVEADLSRRQYEIIRSASKELYPYYSVLKKAKRDCYPPKESYKVTETCAEVNLQRFDLKDSIELMIPAEPDSDDSDSDLEVSEETESDQNEEEPWSSSSP